MKKVILPALILLLSLAFVSCKGRVGTNGNGTPSKTGKIIDITEDSREVSFVRPGDVLLLKLQGSDENNYQWTIKSPLKGNIISLDKHTRDINEDTGEINSEWHLKIEKSAAFEIVFHYENPSEPKDPKEIFQAMVVSDAKKSDAENIYITYPKQEDVIENTFNITGYARVFEATVNYELLDGDGNSIIEGFVQASTGAPEYGYFEKEVEIEDPKTENGVLKVFQISAKDGTEIDMSEIPIRFSQE